MCLSLDQTRSEKCIKSSTPRASCSKFALLQLSSFKLNLDVKAQIYPDTMPTVFINDLKVYKPFEGNTQEEWDAHVINKQDFSLCNNCGWSSYCNEHNSYFSHVKCNANARTGTWSIGENYILKEKPVSGGVSRSYMGPDASISRFLCENSTIPVAKDMRYWKDSKSHFFMMEKIPGETLWTAGFHMSSEERQVIAKEVVQYLVQLRKFTSTKPEAPDGSPIRDIQLGPNERVHYVTEDAEEWWARTEHRFNTKLERYRMNYKEEYPVRGPYVLTHGDLHATNIIVKDGHVTGIIDWEFGGYLPEWWEPIATRSARPPPWAYNLREEWKKQIGPWPEKEEKFARSYKNCFNDYESQSFGVEEYFNPDSLKVCTNYRRYIEETRWGFKETVRQREMRKKKAAGEEAAAFAALKELSLEEHENPKTEDDI
ncbi:hypothetical protein H4I96_06181 [Botrytis cinerea]